jgi:hypothetical protein
MQLQKDWKEEIADNFMKTLQVFEKHIFTFAVYTRITTECDINKRFIRPAGNGICKLKKQKEISQRN